MRILEFVLGLAGVLVGLYMVLKALDWRRP